MTLRDSFSFGNPSLRYAMPVSLTLYSIFLVIAFLDLNTKLGQLAHAAQASANKTQAQALPPCLKKNALGPLILFLPLFFVPYSFPVESGLNVFLPYMSGSTHALCYCLRHHAYSSSKINTHCFLFSSQS